MRAGSRQRKKDEEEMTNLRKKTWELELAECGAWCWEREDFEMIFKFPMQVGWWQSLEQRPGMHSHKVVCAQEMHGHKVVWGPGHYSFNNGS